jgi:hypothetical protein
MKGRKESPMDLTIAKALVRQILSHPHVYPWELKTNGRVALTLVPGSTVLHLFWPDLTVEGGAPIHTHGMDFRSHIIAGELHQWRYGVTDDETAPFYGRLETDLKSNPLGLFTRVHLESGTEEVYRAGDTYEILTPEIHSVTAEPGTVTIIDRLYQTTATGIVAFWPLARNPAGRATGDGKPGAKKVELKVDPIELTRACAESLERWF